MIIALNNKSNLGKKEFLDYQKALSTIDSKSTMILCPTSLNINLFQLDNISLGAQNVSCNEVGAFTGEIAAEHLKESNVNYCIVGHSERREYQKESLSEINQKIIRLEENQIIPILCVGESKEEREEKRYKEIIKKELETAIQDVKEIDKIIIAYEPIWSIGTGIIPTKEEIIEVMDYIKELLPSNKVLYGGSANEENIDMLKTIESIDGYLLGGLSLKPEKLQIFIDKLEK